MVALREWRGFTVEFKREVVQQILRGEKTLAELSSEHDIMPTVIREWKRRYESGATTARRWRRASSRARRHGSANWSGRSGGRAWNWRSCGGDYVAGVDLRDAESVLLQLEQWIEDYNNRPSHSALGMKSPAAYQAAVRLAPKACNESGTAPYPEYRG